MTATGYVSTTGDARKVAKSGDTMTGELVLPDSSPDTALTAASRGYVDTVAATKAATSTQIIAGTGLTGGGSLAADRTLTVTFGTTGTTAAAGNDARLSDARTPTAHAVSHAAAGGDAVTLTQAQVTGLVAALAALAPLAGATFTGPVVVDDSNFSVLGTAKGYRFRPNGSRLDCEATGSDWILSVFSGTNFDGTQHPYLRLESGTNLAHACGNWIFADTPDSAAVHSLLGTDNKLGFHGATAVSKQTVTGSRGGNAALASLLTALANLGLITDGSSA